MARRTESRGPGGGLRRGYISLQIARSLEDDEFEVRRWMARWIEAEDGSRHLARRSAERRRIEEALRLGAADLSGTEMHWTILAIKHR